MIGHEDVCVQIVVEFATHNIDLFSQPLTRPFLREERILLVAGKRQFVGVARIVAGSRTLDSISVVHCRAARAMGAVESVDVLYTFADIRVTAWPRLD